jgi:hypothetical protein
MSSFAISCYPHYDADGVRVGHDWRARLGHTFVEGFSGSRYTALRDAVAAVEKLMQEDGTGIACKTCGRDVHECDHDVKGLIT